MNSYRQRIKIAEACGWRLETELPKYAEVWINPDGFQIGWRRFDDDPWENPPIPDYLNDLNAMHEAEKTLKTTGRWIEYIKALGQIMLRENHKSVWELYCEATHGRGENALAHGIIPYASAAASQRVEAFLKAFSLWEE